MHGPVGAALLGELAGAVQRVDDPDPVRLESLGAGGRLAVLPGQAGVVVLLGEDRVGRPPAGELGAQQIVRGSVTSV